MPGERERVDSVVSFLYLSILFQFSLLFLVCWWNDLFLFFVVYCISVFVLLSTIESTKPKTKMAKKSAAAGKKTSRRKPRRTWSLFISRSLKAISKEVFLGGKAMKVVNSFVNDVFDRVATQAGQLARVNKRRTLGSSEVQTAVRLVLPPELAKHAMAEATRVLKQVATA